MGKAPPDIAGEADDDFTSAPLDLPPDAPREPSATLSAMGGGRRRSVRVATLAASLLLLAVVAVGLFARATTDPGAAIATVLRLPTPTPLPVGSTIVYLTNGAPWGTLTLDGKRMPGADVRGAPITVAPGQHQLDYAARYFPPMRCVFRVPASRADTCRRDTSSDTAQYLATQGAARAFDLDSTGATMQRDQRDALTSLLNDQLSRESDVSVIAQRIRYFDGQGHIVAATQPLRFVLTESLRNAEGGAAGVCEQFCPDPPFTANGAGDDQGWMMRVFVSYAWAITDASGAALTTANYMAGQRYTGRQTFGISIQLTADGLRLTTGLSGISREGALLAANDALDQAAAGEGGGDYGAGINCAGNPLDGCVLGVTYHGAYSQLLWRYGLLIAVDEQAQRVFPQLPTATGADHALVNAITALMSAP